jgi:hypothetical protein
MKVNDSIDAQHIYKLEGNQHVRFMKKQDGQLVYDGTTNEELIAVLIHRIDNLNQKFGCAENVRALCGLVMAKQALEERTKNRTARGVEGQDLV